MRAAYTPWKPGYAALRMVDLANTICADYRARGYDLTLRQLYYQFVARGHIPNNQRSYKQLGDIVNRARLAGLLDWNYIVDRTRSLRGVSHWADPSSVIRSAYEGYAVDKWAEQPTRVEVWVEKEALAGVVSQAAEGRDVDYFSCRGYVSQSELYSAAQRHRRYITRGQNVVVLHLGDHDPSGIDMTRDIRERLNLFIYTDWVRSHHELHDGPNLVEDAYESMLQQCDDRVPHQVKRIALNMDQIEAYNPPPNPAKLTDSRAADYVERFGDESWELDALDPAVLADLIDTEIDAVLDFGEYRRAEEREGRDRELLEQTSDNWPEVVEFLEGIN